MNLNEPKIYIYKDKINIINFISIDHFSSDKIILKLKENYIVVSGNNLVISKLLIDEILVVGNINKIEFR